MYPQYENLITVSAFRRIPPGITLVRITKSIDDSVGIKVFALDESKNILKSMYTTLPEDTPFLQIPIWTFGDTSLVETVKFIIQSREEYKNKICEVSCGKGTEIKAPLN